MRIMLAADDENMDAFRLILTFYQISQVIAYIRVTFAFQSSRSIHHKSMMHFQLDTVGLSSITS